MAYAPRLERGLLTGLQVRVLSLLPVFPVLNTSGIVNPFTDGVYATNTWTVRFVVAVDADSIGQPVTRRNSYRCLGVYVSGEPSCLAIR